MADEGEDVLDRRARRLRKARRARKQQKSATSPSVAVDPADSQPTPVATVLVN